MKKIYSKIGSTMLLSAGLTMCLAACTSDDESTNPSKNEKIAWTFEVGNGDVRTMLYPDKDNKVVFKKGDSISVFNNLEAGASTKAGGDKFVAGKAEDFGDGDTASVAMFNGYANIGAQHFAILYPYQADAAASGITAGSATVTATIPTEQTATPDSFDPKANISVATTEAHAWDVPKFYLRNVCGLLKFTVDATYAKAVIAGANDEDIAGKITVSAETGENPTVVSGQGSKTITLTGEIKSGSNYYVAMLPQEYPNGIIVQLFEKAADDYPVVVRRIYDAASGAPSITRSRILNIGTVKDDNLLWVQLWENGTKWAKKNIGADKVTDYGWYFGWGATKPLWNGTCSGTSTMTGVWVGANPESIPVNKYPKWQDANVYGYSSLTSFFNAPYNNGGQFSWTKYAAADGKTKFELETDDAAYANMGHDWRMPTSDEYTALLNSATHTWVNYNGTNVKGMVFTGKTGLYKYFSLFLPAAGLFNDTLFYYPEVYGIYWSSSLSTTHVWCGYSLYFGETNFYWPFDDWRAYGRSVRAVYDPK